MLTETASSLRHRRLHKLLATCGCPVRPQPLRMSRVWDVLPLLVLMLTELNGSSAQSLLRVCAHIDSDTGAVSRHRCDLAQFPQSPQHATSEYRYGLRPEALKPECRCPPSPSCVIYWTCGASRLNGLTGILICAFIGLPSLLVLPHPSISGSRSCMAASS